MTCRVGVGFVFHDLDFSQPTPMGFARCRRCGGFYTMEQYAAWRCEGAAVEAVVPPRRSSDLPCALCGEAIVVAPEHRELVRLFGSTCPRCFGLVEAIGSAA